MLLLPSHLKTFDVLKVNHLAPCFVDADRDDVNLRESSFQLEEIDARDC
jgi:hypothetical protein